MGNNKIDNIIAFLIQQGSVFEVKQSIVVDGTKSNMMAIHGYSTFNYEHQILVYNMLTELKVSSYSRK